MRELLFISNKFNTSTDLFTILAETRRLAIFEKFSGLATGDSQYEKLSGLTVHLPLYFSHS